MMTGSPRCGCTRRPRNAPERWALPLGLILLVLCNGPAARAQGAAGLDRTCVDVTVGSDRSYQCINAALGQAARQARAPVRPGTLSAGSAAHAVGTFDRAATAERMGDTFGQSVLSQRPPRRVFVAPALERSGHQGGG